MQSLIKTAIKAQIPLIAARTDDPRYFPTILGAIAGKDPDIIRWSHQKLVMGKPVAGVVNINAFMKAGDFGVMDWQEDLDWPEIGKWLEANGAVLVIVNPETVHPWMLDVGTVSMPQSLIEDFVTENVETGTDPLPWVSALSGLSYISMLRISRMAMARHGEFTPKAIRAMRREFFQLSRGLEEVDADQLFYEPSDRLIEWLKLEGLLFRPKTHPLLTPRGFLFKGLPGTGKTSGARYIAKALNVPLYKLDMGVVLSKWVGQSEERLKTALEQADSFEPCVLLLDEVEKLFEINDASGVMPRLLSYLLWWLQEHQSKVLVIMTTNDETKIPPELYRPGRVDEVVTFAGLLQTQLLPFVLNLGHTLAKIQKLSTKELTAVCNNLAPNMGTDHFSQAMVTEQVLRAVKLKVINKGDSSGS